MSPYKFKQHMNPFTLAFEGDKEKLFISSYYEETLNSIRISAVLGIMIWCFFGLLDAAVAPQSKNFLWFIRYVIVTPVMVIGLGSSYIPGIARYLQVIMPLGICYVELGIILMIYFSPEPVKSSYYAGMVVVFLFGFTFVKMRFIWTLLLAIITIICFEAALLINGSVPTHVIYSSSFFLIGAKISGVVASYFIESYHRKEYILKMLLEKEKVKVFDAKNYLEERVNQRTEELRSANHELSERIKDQIKTEHSLIRSRKRIEFLSQELINTQEAERQRIAMDLHDNVAQDLASLKISFDSVIQDEITGPHKINKQFDNYSAILKKAINAIREASYDLQPPALSHLGLSQVLFRLCNDFSTTHNIPVNFSSAGIDSIGLEYDVSINIYRIIQEALNNIKNHAEAERVSVKIVATWPRVIVRIDDNGKGFDFCTASIEAIDNKRMGLSNMEARASLLNGRFTVDTAPDEGTKICVDIPVNGSSNSNYDVLKVVNA